MRAWISILVFGCALIPLSAQDVEVATVNFTNVRAPTGSIGTWLETEIRLNVKAVSGNPRQMVSRVQVSVLLGFELPAPAGGERRLEHYRAEAECVALDPGQAYVRFYLPPELVKRDQLHGDPQYWGVELAVAGHALPAARTAYSVSLPTPEQRKNFQTQAGTDAAGNDGILLPQFLTPFVNEHPRRTPSFVRRDAR